MKSINKLTLAAAVAFSFLAANLAVAQENNTKLLSPRVKGMQPVSVAGTTDNDFDLVREINLKNGSPHSKGDWSRLNSYVILHRTDNNRDLVREMRDLNGSPKAIAQQQEQGQAFQVAPVK